MEVHHPDGNHTNNRRENLALLHGHCHDTVHGSVPMTMARAEEPREGKALTRGSGVSLRRSPSPATIT